MGEEEFSLWLVGGFYRLESAGRFEGEKFSSVLVLDRDWNPIYYAEGGGRLAVRVVEGRPRVTTGSGLLRREVALAALPRLRSSGRGRPPRGLPSTGRSRFGLGSPPSFPGSGRPSPSRRDERSP